MRVRQAIITWWWRYFDKMHSHFTSKFSLENCSQNAATALGCMLSPLKMKMVALDARQNVNANANAKLHFQCYAFDSGAKIISYTFHINSRIGMHSVCKVQLIFNTMKSRNKFNLKLKNAAKNWK